MVVLKTKKCKNCNEDVVAEKSWISCPKCGYWNHFKENKNGRIKKHVCHPPSVLIRK